VGLVSGLLTPRLRLIVAGLVALAAGWGLRFKPGPDAVLTDPDVVVVPVMAIHGVQAPWLPWDRRAPHGWTRIFTCSSLWSMSWRNPPSTRSSSAMRPVMNWPASTLPSSSSRMVSG
jgi:hypothetical protein